jgi:hypothetical protein
MDEAQGESEISEGIQLYQRFFDPRNRYRYSEDDPDIEEVVKVDAFLHDRLYGCQVIVTNCSVSSHQINILREIPDGAVPVFDINYQLIKDYTI